MNLSVFDSYLFSEWSSLVVAGVDEVGRGALFGPVAAAAVAVPLSMIPPLQKIGVKDSKLLSAKQRSGLVPQIKSVSSWHISSASVAEIERFNILQASLLAMKRAVAGLNQQPAFCFVDGLQSLPRLSVPQLCLVKGERKSPLIAAASILAKVWRDELIVEMAEQYPNYDLANNKGYGTQKHCLALRQYGPSSQHRLTFAPCRLIK